MLSGDPSDQSSLLDAPATPATLAVIPTWLLRSTVVSMPAKIVYLYLSALNDGDEFHVSEEQVLAAIPDLHTWFRPPGFGGEAEGLWDWLDELQGTALVTFDGYAGRRDSGYRVRFDLYRQEPTP